MSHFKIIVPVFNAERYIASCLRSIASQVYKDYEVCVIDDCSSDNTWRIINDMHHRYGNSFNICRNDYRVGSALANIVKAIELFSASKEDVLVIVDGDDWLYDVSVLNHINLVYEDKNIWMTYGQFVPVSGAYPAYCQAIPDTKTYRKQKLWYASHLKTFKRGLWDKIKDADLRDKSGRYYPITGDASYMYPMVEMCGQKHMKFITKLTYVYNDRNPLNDSKVGKEYQLSMGEEIQAKPIYLELQSL